MLSQHCCDDVIIIIPVLRCGQLSATRADYVSLLSSRKQGHAHLEPDEARGPEPRSPPPILLQPLCKGLGVALSGFITGVGVHMAQVHVLRASIISTPSPSRLLYLRTICSVIYLTIFFTATSLSLDLH